MLRKIARFFFSDSQYEDSQSTSAGFAAGIATLVTILAVLPLGVLIGCFGLWCITTGRRATETGNEGNSDMGGGRSKGQGAVIYEEPEPELAASIIKNVAYGNAEGQRRTSTMPLTESFVYETVQAQKV